MCSFGIGVSLKSMESEVLVVKVKFWEDGSQTCLHCLSCPPLPCLWNKVYFSACFLSSPKWFYKETHEPLQRALKQGGPGSKLEVLWVTRMFCCFVKPVDILRTKCPSLTYNSQKQEAAWQSCFHKKKGLYKKRIHRGWFLSLENSPQWKYELKPWPQNNLRKKRNLLREVPPLASCSKASISDDRKWCRPGCPFVTWIYMNNVSFCNKLVIKYQIQERQRERRVRENRQHG